MNINKIHFSIKNIITIIIMIFIIYTIIYPDKFSADVFRDEHFQGVIEDKELVGARNQGCITIVGEKKYDFYPLIRHLHFIQSHTMYIKIQLGDYIIKRKGESFYHLVQQNQDTTIYYP